MNKFPDINEFVESPQTGWVEVEKVVPVLIDEFGPLSNQEIHHLSDDLRKQQYIYPESIRLDEDSVYAMSSKDHFKLGKSRLIDMKNFLERAITKEDVVIIGTTSEYDHEEGDNVIKLIMTTQKSCVGTHVTEKFLNKWRHQIPRDRKYRAQLEVEKAAEEEKKQKLEVLIKRFQSKEITLHDFDAQYAKLKSC